MEIGVLPEGHGLSFKRGICDGLLGTMDRRNDIPQDGHEKSYRRGTEFGTRLRHVLKGRDASYKDGVVEGLLCPFGEEKTYDRQAHNASQNFGFDHGVRIRGLIAEKVKKPKA